MLILAFDTSGAACAAALWHDGVVLGSGQEAMARGQAERLIPLLDTLMADAGIDYRAIDAVAASAGPGSFTGIRVGLAAMHGIALATGAVPVAVPSFAALARGIARREPPPWLLALDTRRNDLYALLFEAPGAPAPGWPENGRVVAPQCLPELVGSLCPALAGDGRDLVLTHLDPARVRITDLHLPEPQDIAAEAADLLRACPTPPTRPIYLRPPEATLPRFGGGLRPPS